MEQARNIAPENDQVKEVVRISPMFNDVFLRVFGCQDSKAATRSLVNSIFRIAGLPDIGEIDSIAADTGYPGNNVTCKLGRTDVVLVSDNRIINLEAQKYHVDIKNKALFYASKLMGAYMGKGEDYRNMPQVIVVMLVDGCELLPESNRIVSTSQLRWEGSAGFKSFSDRMIFVLVELDKVVSRYNEIDQVIGDEALAWLYLLTSGYSNETEVERLMGQFPSIEEFAKLYGIAIDDPDIKKMYESYQLDVMEENSMRRFLEEVREESREQGLEQGLERGLDRATTLLAGMGLDDQAIEQFKRAYQQDPAS